MLKNKLVIMGCVLSITLAISGSKKSMSSTSGEYVATPPFITSGAPPLVMLVMGRDHKLYYEAYNDASDLDGDGDLETRYKPTIDYYGYFDSFKYYKYESGRFVPKGYTADKKAPSTDAYWSGDFLNYLTMSRIDVLRKVLYGGYRSIDSNDPAVGTELERAYITNDAHCWGKEYVAPSGYSSSQIISYNGFDIRDYTPYNLPVAGTNHLFASGSVVAPGSSGYAPLLRVALGSHNRIWNWVTVESGTSIMSKGLVDGTDEPDMTVKVQVGVSSLPNLKYEKLYTHSTTGVSIYKPAGILQRFGETGSMLFGLMSGSYENHLSGGVLRKNIGLITDEINSNTGQFLYKTTSVGGIIKTIDNLRIVGFNHSTHYWDYTTYARPINEGENYMWGNPIGEMMYESLRYFAGQSASSEFVSGVTNGNDRGLVLPLESWRDPYDTIANGGLGYAECAKPFMLVLSDINPSYDTNQLPGVYSQFANSPAFPGTLGTFGAEDFADKIFSNEGFSGTGEHFIGQSNTFFDTACSAKTVTGFGSIRGLCPEEPTKLGGYYSAAAAYYGKVNDISPTATGDQNVSTYAVALASPLPKIEIPMGNDTITMVPLAKTVYSTGGGGVTPASNDFQPTCAIVDFYVESITSTSGKFSVTYEHAEQGSDYDMDATITYEYKVTSSSTIEVSLASNPPYGGGSKQHFGYIISGTTADGTYLEIKNITQPDSEDVDYYLDTPGNADASGNFAWNDGTALPNAKTREFTVNSSVSVATLLEDPLYYAAKWGGSEDKDSNGTLETDEWDKDGDGTPDNYFYVINPLKLEAQLNQSFASILKEASSGTAASVISNTRTGEGAVYQSIFYPTITDTTADANTVTWVGQVHSLLVDAYGHMREDANGNQKLDVKGADLNGDGRVYHEDINMNCILDVQTTDTDGNGILDTEDTNGNGVLDTEFATTCETNDSFLSTLDPIIVNEGILSHRYYDVNGDGILQDREIIFNIGHDVDDSHPMNYLWNANDWLNSITDADIVIQRPTYISDTKQRYIFTWVDADGDGIVNANVGDDEIKDFVWPTLTTPTYTDLSDPDKIYPYLHLYSSFGDRPSNIDDLITATVESPIDDPDFVDFLLKETEREVKYIRGLDYVNADGTPVTLSIGGNPITGTELRPRKYDGKTWRLGDIAYSTPTAVGPPAEANHLIYRDDSYADFAAQYQDRRTVIYAGANDGMLHAFNGGFYDYFNQQFCREITSGYNPYDNDTTNDIGCSSSTTMPELGAELWAYIPYNLLPHLHWLTEPDYAHSYYVDQKPRLFDAKVFNADTVHPNGWGTVMVVGMRFGGATIIADIDKSDGAYNAAVDRTMKSAFLIFDVTDPEIEPTLLGEISMPEMGFSTSYPTMVVMKDGDHDGRFENYDDASPEIGENRWFLAFGSGPADSSGDPHPDVLDTAASSQSAKFYLLDLFKLVSENELWSLTDDSSTGTVKHGVLTAGLHWYSELDSNSFVSDPITVDYDLDYNADALYYGTVSTNGSTWEGMLRRIVIDDRKDGDEDQDPSNWEPDSILFNAQQPITAAATVGLDDDGRHWVYFGTGRYFVTADAIDLNQQSYYGIKEPLVSGTNEKSWAEVNVANLINTTNYKVFTDRTVGMGSDGLTPSTWSNLLSEQNGADGWQIDFVDVNASGALQGERNLGQAALLGGTLAFTSFIPSNDTCVSGGESYLWAVYYKTGTAYFNPIIGTTTYTYLGVPKELSSSSINIGEGVATTPNIHVGGGDGSSAFIQTSTGAIEILTQKNPFEVKSGMRSWKVNE